MTTFNITWTITLAAKTHREAAEKARKIMKGSGSDAPYFRVASRTITKGVDLAEEDDETTGLDPEGS